MNLPPSKVHLSGNKGLIRPYEKKTLVNKLLIRPYSWGGVFLLEVQYSILKSLISTCVLSYIGSREDWLLDRICESKKDCWDSIRRTSYPYQ